ncbi:serine protease inhibitor 88Ea-like isoform X2 [Contarinia nasturtii]|uniref:serine protease inhibitor 88Ea-like isoform X2 n=1 Tax=Contarinia nasturtii TaxID=265458 RepID=UPI0012D4AE54|nr:serine protease inhibitor 88Ea-like isoform X2 [Contarinia nasturtii]
MDKIDEKSFPSGEDEQRMFFERQREFSFKLLETMNKCKKRDNLILSSYSIDRVLLMTYFDASNKTKRSLEKLLYLKNVDKETVARSFRSKPNDDQHVEFVCADKSFVSNNIELNGPIKNLFKEDVGAYIERMDFINPENSRIAINNFIENTTKHEIKNMIEPGIINQSSAMVLVNAAYFKAFWMQPFAPHKTKTEVFHGLKDTMVDMMHKGCSYAHYTVNYSMQFKALRLAFHDSGDFSMYYFLPFTIISNIDIFLSRFSRENFDKTEEKLNNMEYVDIKLPKMSFEQSFDMIEILKKMGVKHFFCGDPTDFSDFTTSDLGVDSAFHSAKIEVNENGTTAAASTIMIKRLRSYTSNPPTFHCNLPFVFVIHDKQRNAILFSGIYRGPN